MKFFIISLFCFINSDFVYSQNTALSPVTLLDTIATRLQNLKTLQYELDRELNYSSENYHNNSRWSVYYDFSTADTLIGVKYQIDDAGSKQVFNGSEAFELDKNTKSILINSSPTENSFAGQSAFYNSLLTLKNILPLLVADKVSKKTISDTTINNKVFSSITINIGKRRIQNLGKGFDIMNTQNNFIYTLVIDTRNYLPVEVLQRNDLNNDFIKTSFDNIQLNSNPPAEISWYYSTYMNEYKLPASIDTLKLLSIGSMAPEWKLRAYNKSKILSLSDLKGNVVLVDFWIKNCSPCILSVPHLNELQHKFENTKFKTASINAYDSNEDISWFYNKHNIQYPVLINGKKIGEKYGVSGYPTFFIVDKTGKIAYVQTGYNPTIQTEIEQIIQKLLYPATKIK